MIEQKLITSSHLTRYHLKKISIFFGYVFIAFAIYFTCYHSLAYRFSSTIPVEIICETPYQDECELLENMVDETPYLVKRKENWNPLIPKSFIVFERFIDGTREYDFKFSRSRFHNNIFTSLYPLSGGWLHIGKPHPIHSLPNTRNYENDEKRSERVKESFKNLSSKIQYQFRRI